MINNSRDSRVLYTFAANKSKISPTISVLLKTFNSELSDIEAWFTDQNRQSLETEYRKKINLAIK